MLVLWIVSLPQLSGKRSEHDLTLGSILRQGYATFVTHRCREEARASHGSDRNQALQALRLIISLSSSSESSVKYFSPLTNMSSARDFFLWRRSFIFSSRVPLDMSL